MEGSGKEEERKSLAATPRQRGDGTPAPSVAVWHSYAQAYEDRYHVPPVRNAKVNAQLAQFVSRMPADDAPLVAAFYLGHNRQAYAESGHCIGLMLRDAEKLHTEWMTGRRITSGRAREGDRLQTSGDMWNGLISDSQTTAKGMVGQ